MSGGVDADAPSPLMAAFLEKREMLRRAFVARAGADAAEDLLQELYLKLLQIRPTEPLANVDAYLFKLAFNLIIDVQRAGARRSAREDRWYRDGAVMRGGEDVAPIQNAEQTLAAKQDLEKVMATIGALPPQTQRVFTLHKVDGLSYREVAATLGVSTSAVEKHMSRALKRLLTAFER